MRLSQKFLQIIQETNSISTEPVLDIVDRDMVDVIVNRAENDSYLNSMVQEMTKLAFKINIEDTETKIQLFNLYAEASLYVELLSKVSVERVQETEEKRPDFRINFRGNDYFAEIKSLSSVDVLTKARKEQYEALEGQINLEEQLKNGKKVPFTERVVQPYFKGGKAYSPYGRKLVIESIVDKVRQNFKAGQYKIGETILIVDLGHLIIPGNPLEELLPVYYDNYTKYCISGILWHVAFGRLGMQIFRPDPAGRSNIDGILEREGILIENADEIRAIFFVVRGLQQKTFVGLFRHSDASIEFEDLVATLTDLYNDERNSFEHSLRLRTGNTFK